MKHLFGPVPSRRLGRSLGIDPVPFKTCNWNCVYCQLGRTTPLTNSRQEYIPTREIIAEARDFFETQDSSEVDWVSFVGSGETTLHSGLGEMIRAVKDLAPKPVAVFTNGALLSDAGVREELLPADAVLPSLDAGSAEVYRKVNRPWPSLTFDSLVEGLTEFRREYDGQLWLEVMLVKGLNDGDAELSAMAKVMERIEPDQVQINVPVRPPAESWVEAPDERTLARAKQLLGRAARKLAPQDVHFDFRGRANIAETILEVITRHPMREDQILETLSGCTGEDIGRALRELSASGRARQITRGGKRFWSAAGARYGG